MTGLLPYLKYIYGDTVESYFSAGEVSMQSKQIWDKEKGGVIGEDDEFISSMTAEESWLYDDIEVIGNTNRKTGNAASEPIIKIDAKNMVSRDIPDVDDNATLPSLDIKVEDIEEEGDPMLNDILHTPPPMQRTIINDDSTISSNITMDMH